MKELLLLLLRNGNDGWTRFIIVLILIGFIAGKYLTRLDTIISKTEQLLPRMELVLTKAEIILSK